jgi:Tfp pilus assembly protein PilZ
VSIEIRGPSGRITGRTKDVSEGGLAALIDTPIDAGTDVELAISLVFDEDTFSEPLALPARVVWCTPLGQREHQIGTAFSRLSPEQAEFLGMFLRYLKEAERAANARNDPAPPASDSDDPFAS